MKSQVPRPSDSSAAARSARSANFVGNAITGHLRRMGLSVISPDSGTAAGEPIALLVEDGLARVFVTIEAATR